MSGRYIDIRQMPSQSWIIAFPSEMQTLLQSPVITPPHRLQSQSPRSSEGVAAAASTLEDKLFDNAAELKVTLSQIVMHLNPTWRNVIFRQLDALLGSENWQDDSAFIQKSSFMTFLRFIIFAAPTELPSLGVSQAGNVLASWHNGNQRIAVEFFESDRAVATFVKQGSRAREAMSWRGHVVDLKNFIDANAMIGCWPSAGFVDG